MYFTINGVKKIVKSRFHCTFKSRLFTQNDKLNNIKKEK